MKRRQEGQVLVLFALLLTVLIGASALVVDIGMKYASERAFQALADAASLAGAQELQPTSRTSPVTPAMQTDARTEALRIVLAELTGTTTTPGCPPANNIDCTIAGGRYRIVIQTPSPNCVDCVAERAVQVRVEEPNRSTTFAGLFGQSTWNLNRTSVAGLSFGRAYTIVTLRPPQPLGGSSGFDVRDFRLEGTTKVVVSKGDVATNANMEYGGTGNILMLDSGYNMYYYDPYHDPDWSPPLPENPVGKKLSSMVLDPGYVVPPAPAVVGAIAPDGAGSACLAAATTLLTGAGSTYAPYIPVSSPTTPDMGKITCLLPGFYATDPIGGGGLKNDTIILLTDPAQHGLFYFDAGIKVQSSLIGGYEAGSPGVAIVVPQEQEFNMNTGGTGVTALALNAGTRFLSATGTEATPALDFADKPIVTNTTPATKMSLIVTRAAGNSCPVIEFPYPSGCNDSANDTIKIAGNSAIYLAGVQFMPSDNSSINSSAAEGYIGQIWAWTLKYSGGVRVNQEGTSKEGAGVLRIDTACSPGTACVP